MDPIPTNIIPAAISSPVMLLGSYLILNSLNISLHHLLLNIYKVST
jgi:hypothetical protein